MAALFDRAWLECDFDALRHNYNTIAAGLTPGCRPLCVVKADAYGHGAAQLAPALQRAGADWFGVATAPEGASLRRAGVTGDILVLAYTPPEWVGLLLEQRLTQSLASACHARALNDAAGALGGRLPAHLKLDTGMTRTGVDCQTDEQLDEAAALYRLPHLAVTGAFSHFSSADDARPGAEDYSRLQLARYRRALDGLTARGIDVGLRHLANSGGTETYSEAHFDRARCGAMLLGYHTAAQPDLTRYPLRPVASLKAAVACLRDIPTGTAVSYGRTFVAERPMRVATLCIGYADGIPRALSNRGRVILGNGWAPILGNICMDQLMVDVTDCPGEIVPGSAALLIGSDGTRTQTADDLAAAAGTCTHEILSRLGARLERRYYERGELVGTVES